MSRTRTTSGGTIALTESYRPDAERTTGQKACRRTSEITASAGGPPRPFQAEYRHVGGLDVVPLLNGEEPVGPFSTAYDRPGSLRRVAPSLLSLVQYWFLAGREPGTNTEQIGRA